LKSGLLILSKGGPKHFSRSSKAEEVDSCPQPLCVLWDESLLWGIMLTRALKALNVPFTLIRASEAESQLLGTPPPGTLLVPGGFASRKAMALGTKGTEAVRSFVRRGGFYLGFCGGAGLALNSPAEPTGLGLCPWGRKPMHARLPNFSGHIEVILNPEDGMSPEASIILAPAWWPSQFEPVRSSSVRVLARYGQPGPDFWVADLPFEELTQEDLHWWEHLYGINLQPKLISNAPCVIQGSFGHGRYLLSYVHLESPHSRQANQWLLHLLSPDLQELSDQPSLPEWDLQHISPVWDDPVLIGIRQALEDLILQGQSQFLFCWRSSWLLGWKRGIPGFALNTLLALVSQILELKPSPDTRNLLHRRRETIKNLFQNYQDSMSAYLRQERKLALCRQGAPAPTGADELQDLRRGLVGPFPGQGGLYGQLAGELDHLLWTQLQAQTLKA